MKVRRFWLWLCSGLILAVMVGCGQTQSAPSETGGQMQTAPCEDSKQPQSALGKDGIPLCCTVIEEDHAFSSEDLGGNFDGSLRYKGLEVSVTVSGKEVPLEDAVREGTYSVEQLVADVQTDARNGICQEETRTKNGLTEFHYSYPDVFSIDVINDIYQTPDGQEHLFRSVTINKNGDNEAHDFTHVMADPEQPNILIDREDWGLTMEAADVSSTGLTLKITQSGGQQAGTLEVASYWISSTVDGELGYFSPALDPAVSIPPDSTSSLSLNWENELTLPSGDYFLKVWVNDNYDPEAIHPLIHKFHDQQSYILFFTIP